MFMFHHMFYACAWLVFPCLVYSCCVCIHMSVACIYMRGSKCELRHFLCESTLSNHVDISSKIIARAREILISSINNWKLAIKITWLLAQKSLSRKNNNWNILPELYRCTPPELYYYIISWIRQDIFFFSLLNYIPSASYFRKNSLWILLIYFVPSVHLLKDVNLKI